LIAPSGAIAGQHLAPVGAYESDWVAVAERFLGVPYLWGGKTSLGIDCSGLVQVSLQACGIVAPRDSDMQEAALGTPLAKDGALPSSLRRGDLVFWPGHVGIMRDAESLLHATAHAMQVIIEPLSVAVRRVSARGQEISGVRRIG
jgi:cell wall-associated NlpC family hydrolase